jgi:hypothetical protein
MGYRTSDQNRAERRYWQAIALQDRPEQEIAPTRPLGWAN